MKKKISALILSALLLTNVTGVFAAENTATRSNSISASRNLYESSTVKTYTGKSTNGNYLVAIAKGQSQRADYYKFQYITKGKAVRTYTSRSFAFAAHGLNDGIYTVKISAYKNGNKVSQIESSEAYVGISKDDIPKINGVLNYSINTHKGPTLKTVVPFTGKVDYFKVTYKKDGKTVSAFTSKSNTFYLEGRPSGKYEIEIITYSKIFGETDSIISYGYIK